MHERQSEAAFVQFYYGSISKITLSKKSLTKERFGECALTVFAMYVEMNSTE